MTLIVGGAAAIYAISKLDTVKSIFGYLVILIAVCAGILIVMPESPVGGYAEQTLAMVQDLLGAIADWIRSQIGGMT